MIWRVVLDPRVPDGLADLRASWTFADLWQCCDMLDQADVLDAQERARIKAGVSR